MHFHPPLPNSAKNALDVGGGKPIIIHQWKAQGLQGLLGVLFPISVDDDGWICRETYQNLMLEPDQNY